MTIAQGKRDAPQHVSCPAANASTTQLHLFDSSLFVHLLSVIRIILFPVRNLVLPNVQQVGRVSMQKDDSRSYFGAREFTIFSNPGSPRSGLHSGCNFKRP